MAKTPQEITALNEAKQREAELNLKLASSLEEEAKARAELDDILIDSLKHQIAHADALGISADKVKELTESVSALITVRKEDAAVREATTKGQQEYNAAVLRAKGQTEALIDTLTGLSSKWDQQTAAIGLTTASAEGFVQGVKEAAGVTNVLGSIFVNTFEASLELATSFDEMTVSLNKATGQGSRLESELMALEQASRMHGVTTSELSDAAAGLTSNFNSFIDTSASTRGELIEGVALLDKFGISADSTAKNLGLMTAAMGMSAEAAINTQMAMFAFAQKEGLDTNKFFADFEAHRGTMAKFGDQGVDVFKELAFAAQKSNMEMGQLLSIVEKFDRFDTAAESVGQLNALLGGPFLNSLEMVTATNPIDRLKMLQDSLVSAGKDFQSMTYYEKQAIASAMGLKDVGELALLMGGQFEHLAGGAEMSQEQYEELAKQSAEFNTLMEELRQTMQMFALSLKPVFDFLKFIANTLQELSPATRKAIGILILGVGGLIMLGKILYAFTSTVAVARVAFAGATVAAAGAESSLTGAPAAAIPVMKLATPLILAFGAASLKLGLAVGIAALGLAGLVYTLSLVNPSQILAGAGAIGVMSIVLGVIVGIMMALVSGPQAGVLGLAILALYGIAGAFAVAAVSGALFASSLSGLTALSGKEFLIAATGIAAMAMAIRALPVVKTVMLKTVFDSAEAFQTSATIAAAALGQVTATAAPGAPAKAPKVNVVIKQNADMRALSAFIKQTSEEHMA